MISVFELGLGEELGCLEWRQIGHQRGSEVGSQDVLKTIVEVESFRLLRCP